MVSPSIRTVTPANAVTQDGAQADAPDPIVAERLARYHRDRNISVLWPGLRPAALAAAQGEIERVVRAVLAGGKPAPLAADTEAAAYALKIACFTTGTGALLGYWTANAILETSPQIGAFLAHELAQGRKRAARIEHEVGTAFDALIGRGIAPVVLKGFHTARTCYPEPSVRPVADVDVLVPPERVADAESALRDAGFLPTTPPHVDPRRPYKRHWRAAHVDPRHFSVEGIDARSPWELDLHASFNREFPGALARLDHLAGHCADWLVAGRRLLAPVHPLLLHVLASHTSLGLKSIRIMRLVDLVQVIRMDSRVGTLEWEAVLRSFRDSDTARFTYPALALTEDLAPGTVDARVLAEARSVSSRTARRVTSRLRPGTTSVGVASFALLLMWAPGPVAELRLLAQYIAREIALGPRSLVATLRMLVRRMRSGLVTLGAPDERRQ